MSDFLSSRNPATQKVTDLIMGAGILSVLKGDWFLTGLLLSTSALLSYHRHYYSEEQVRCREAILTEHLATELAKEVASGPPEDLATKYPEDTICQPEDSCPDPGEKG